MSGSRNLVETAKTFSSLSFGWLLGAGAGGALYVFLSIALPGSVTFEFWHLASSGGLIGGGLHKMLQKAWHKLMGFRAETRIEDESFKKLIAYKKTGGLIDEDYNKLVYKIAERSVFKSD